MNNNRTSAVVLSLIVLTSAAVAVPASAATKATGAKKPNAIAAAKKKSAQAPLQSPTEFIASRAQRVLAALKSRPLLSTDESMATKKIEATPAKADWLQAVYNKNLIETSWATEMLSDKRILAEVLRRELGPQALAYYPKTLGLREFLVSRGLVNAKGEISANGDQIEQALSDEFPAGFIVRPAVGIAPQETGRGLYPETDQFIVDLLKPDSQLYQPSHLRQPVRSHILDAVASGEAIVLQENFIAASDAKKPLKKRFFQEVRVHTYENRVVEGAVPTRWVQTNLLTKTQIHRAEEFAGELLKSLSLNLLNKQAWGVDVAVMDNGEMRVIDIVTNRGRPIAWSGYLDQPRVIGAYSRHFEHYYGVRFAGVGGALIRYNFANYMPYWEKRIEKARPGLSKVVAYLPPLP